MVRNALPFIVFFLFIQKNPRELEALIRNAQRIMDTMDRINSIPDLKKITEIVDNFSA